MVQVERTRRFFIKKTTYMFLLSKSTSLKYQKMVVGSILKKIFLRLLNCKYII